MTIGNQRIWTAMLFGLTLTGIIALPAAGEVVNRIVLQVNDRIATLKDYEIRRAQMLADLEQAAVSPEEKAAARQGVGQRVFRDLYEEMILLSRADQLDIRVPDERLDQVVVQIREEMGVTDEESFEIALAQTGMSMEDFRERWRQNLRMREVMAREVTSQVQANLDREELRRVYRENPDWFRVPARVKVREVVVLEDGPGDPTERRALAEEIRSLLLEDGDVEQALAEHVEAGSTSLLIDHGWVEPGELAPALDEVAFDLTAGEVSDPIPARGGLHVLQVVERSEPTVQPFDEVADLIRQREQQRLFDKRYREYMDELEEASFIRIEPPPEAAGFRGVEGSLADDVVPETPEGAELTSEAAAEGELQEVAEEAKETAEEATAGEPDVLPVGAATGSATDDAPDAAPPDEPPLEPTADPEEPPEPADPPPAGA